MTALIKLEKGSSNGTLHCTAQFIPSFALKFTEFTSQYNDRSSISSEDDFLSEPTYTWNMTLTPNTLPNVPVLNLKPNQQKGVWRPVELLLAQSEGCFVCYPSFYSNLTLESGIIVFHVISGRLTKKGRLEILLDGYWPCMSTVKARKPDAQWDCVGKGFIKEIDFRWIELRLNEAPEGDKDVIVAKWKGDLKPFIEATLVSFYDIYSC